jgi:hypothetical protein
LLLELPQGSLDQTAVNDVHFLDIGFQIDFGTEAMSADTEGVGWLGRQR